jgi:hypothetical protein
MVDDIVLLVDNLMAGTKASGRATVSLSADKNVWHERNRAFWHRLLEGPRGRKVKGGGQLRPLGKDHRRRSSRQHRLIRRTAMHPQPTRWAVARSEILGDDANRDTRARTVSGGIFEL